MDEYRRVADPQVDDEENSSEDESDLSSTSSCPLSAKLASKLSTAFAKATGIDPEVAVQLLADHGWNIDQALSATYEAKEQAQSMMVERSNWRTGNGTRLKILSWNTDTGDTDDVQLNEIIQQRTDTIVEILLREQPDIILLQQVGTLALTLIITCLSSIYDDESVQIDSPKNCNYVSVFTKKSQVKKAHVSIIQHDDNWKMIKVQIAYRDSIGFDVFNAFIDESENSQETLSFCLDEIRRHPSARTALVGISSKMLNAVDDSSLSNLTDVWEATGRQAETTYTFDPALNTNVNRCERPARFDRLYFRASSLVTQQIRPVRMELEGIQHTKGSNDLFPSTHWAIQCYFDVHD